MPFADAAPVFAPQKGAGPDQVAVLSHRLDELADRYQARYGIDVRTLPGAGAGRGLGGGLAAWAASCAPATGWYAIWWA